MECQYHPGTYYEWFRDFRDKKVYACKICKGVEKQAITESGPRIKYSPTFHRERPLTDLEKRYPPKRG